MKKITKKLIVYLDQNFISEIAKFDVKQGINPRFKNIYELLHQGFINEKIVVPRSWFHDIETSMVPEYEERIEKFQGYLGQVKLRFPDIIKDQQIHKAARQYLGQNIEECNVRDIFDEDPDEIVKHISIRIKSSNHFDHKSERTVFAEKLNMIRENINEQSLSYEEQLKKELTAQSNHSISAYWVDDLFLGDVSKIKDFFDSEMFKNLPIINIYSQMWSKLLVHYPKRDVKESDSTDIDIISAYLPYIDVLATDKFMANLIKNMKFDNQYNTTVFSSSERDLELFEKYLSDYLNHSDPVNKPALSVFVLCDEETKNLSWDFFQKLAFLDKPRDNPWVEIFAFDDGSMPQWKMVNKGGITWPFYGMQEVNVIQLENNYERNDVIDLCNNYCRSDYYLLIDSYMDLPNDLFTKTMECCKNSKNKVFNYSIFKAKN